MNQWPLIFYSQILCLQLISSFALQYKFQLRYIMPLFYLDKDMYQLVAQKMQMLQVERLNLMDKLEKIKDNVKRNGEMNKPMLKWGLKAQIISRRTEDQMIMESLNRQISNTDESIKELNMKLKEMRQERRIQNKTQMEGKNPDTRLNGPMRFLTNEVVTHKITVNQIELYYQPYTDQDINSLLIQYQKITNHPLRINQSYFDIKIQLNTPLELFVEEQRGERALQIVLNLAQWDFDEKILKILHEEIDIFKKVTNQYYKSRLISYKGQPQMSQIWPQMSQIQQMSKSQPQISEGQAQISKRLSQMSYMWSQMSKRWPQIFKRWWRQSEQSESQLLMPKRQSYMRKMIWLQMSKRWPQIFKRWWRQPQRPQMSNIFWGQSKMSQIWAQMAKNWVLVRQQMSQIWLQMSQRLPQMSQRQSYMHNMIWLQMSKRWSQMLKRQFPYKISLNLINFTDFTNLLYQVNQDALIIDIIRFVIKLTNEKCIVSDISISDHNNRVIPEQQYQNRMCQYALSLQKNQTIQQRFSLTYLPNSCYFSAQSHLISRLNQIYQQINIQQIQGGQFLTYNPETQKCEMGKIHGIKKIPHIKQLYKLKANFDKEHLEISCSKQTLLLNQKKQWIAVKNIQNGDKVFGMSSEQSHQLKSTVIPYTVVSIQKEQNWQQWCYSISSPRYNTLILNRFVVHNKNQIDIEVHHIKEVEQVIMISSFRDNKLSDVFENQVFKDKRCQIAGNRLNRQNTFGDYIFNRKCVIYVYQPSCIPQSLIISERNQKNIHYKRLPEQAKVKLNKKLKFDYLVFKQSKINLFKQIDENTSGHLIVDKRGSLEQFNYLQNIEPIYRRFEQSCYQTKRQQIADQYIAKDIDQRSFYGIRAYTEMGLISIYEKMNYFLYKEYGRTQPIEEKYKNQFPMVGWIYKSLNNLPNYEGTVYRGVKDVDLRYYLGLHRKNGINNQTITLNAFTSTSIDQKQAKKFSNNAGCLFQIRGRTGKLVQQYSVNSKEREVIFLPFTQFLILDHKLQATPQTAILEQIPFPHIDSKKIIFWVDDNPQNNAHIADKFRLKGIQVVEVLSTKIMKIIIEKYFWMFNMMGKKVLMFSDMTREENRITNQAAGIQLLKLIYNSYGLSNNVILFFFKDIQSAERRISQSGVGNNGKWLVTDKIQMLIKKTSQVFQVALEISVGSFSLPQP